MSVSGNLPLSMSGRISSMSKRIRKNSRRINPNLSFRRPSSSIHHSEPESNVTASKASIIRTICGQIFQDLYDASDKLDDDMLQNLSFEFAKISKDTIKRKMSKPSKEDLRITSSKKHSVKRSHSAASLRQAINLRMANVVEKDENLLSHTNSNKNKSSDHYNGGSTSSKNVLDLFVKLPDDNGQYDAFLNICSPDLMTNHEQLRRDLIAFKRSDSNVPYMLLVLLCCWVVFNRIVFLSYRYNITSLQKYHPYVMKLYDSLYGQLPDNMTIICAALSTGFYLINIVLMGWCDPDIVVNVNHHHGCVTFIEPPPESFVFTMIFTLLLQIAARGVSRIALVCSWIICLVAINVSMYLSNSGSYVWINVLQILILCASYEMERLPLRQFIKTLKAIEDGEMAAKLKVRLAAYETLQASDALKAKCSLVRHIGHEIRTPLNVVGVGIDMLHKELAKHGSTIPDEVKDIVVEIQEASSASLEVVNELLMFEKLAAGMTTLECVPTTILGFLEQAMKQHFLPARAKNIMFELIPSTVTHNVAIDVDPIKLVTVFRNLFSNAIKFTKKQGRVTVRTEVKKVEDIEVVEVTVQDTGAGLSAANLGKLFGEGVQFNANGLQGGGGSGLGLFISKGIVQLHKHGKIWAESEGEGFGCTFFVQLPLYSHNYVPTSTGTPLEGSFEVNFKKNTEPFVTELNKSILTSEKQKQQRQGQGQVDEGHDLVISHQPAPVQSPVIEWKPTILVVDDSSMNRKMLVRMLVSKGFTCCEAEDGVEGLSEMSRMYLRRTLENGRPVSPGNGQVHEVASKGASQVASCRGSYQKSHIRVGSRAEAENFAIDAVLIDSNMPRMNGPEAIKEMRKVGFRGPIIGVSGGDEKTLKEFLEAGADNVLQKPAQSDKLIGLLLTGFHLLVQEGKSRYSDQSSTEGNNVSTSEKTRWEYVQRLCTFIEKTDASVQTNANVQK